MSRISKTQKKIVEAHLLAAKNKVFDYPSEEGNQLEKKEPHLKAFLVEQLL